MLTKTQNGVTFTEMEIGTERAYDQKELARLKQAIEAAFRLKVTQIEATLPLEGTRRIRVHVQYDADLMMDQEVLFFVRGFDAAMEHHDSLGWDF